MAEKARGALTRALATLAVAAAIAAAIPAAGAAGPQKSKPAWAELSVSQQEILSPLKADWEQLTTSRKTNWVGIANRYPRMKPEE